MKIRRRDEPALFLSSSSSPLRLRRLFAFREGGGGDDVFVPLHGTIINYYVLLLLIIIYSKHLIST
jgi:hypothetical protein